MIMRIREDVQPIKPNVIYQFPKRAINLIKNLMVKCLVLTDEEDPILNLDISHKWDLLLTMSVQGDHFQRCGAYTHGCSMVLNITTMTVALANPTLPSRKGNELEHLV